jgi:hypothetical protein
MFEVVVKLMCKGNDYTAVKTKQIEMDNDGQAV